MLKIQLKKSEYSTVFQMTISNESTIRFMGTVGLGAKTLRATIGQKAEYILALLTAIKGKLAEEAESKNKTYVAEIIDRLERTCATIPDAYLDFQEVEAEEVVEEVEAEEVEEEKPSSLGEGVVKKTVKRIKKAITG